MAGKMCPSCGKATFFETPTGRECSKCGATMKIPTNEGKGGKGKKCSNCGKSTVSNDRCSKCGATYKLPK